MRKIVARNGIAGLFAGKFFPISNKFQTREFLIIDVNMHKLYISISVNTVSYAIVCIYKATDMQTLASPGIFLIEYHGIKPWREERPKKAG